MLIFQYQNYTLYHDMRRTVNGRMVSDAAKQYAEWIIELQPTYVNGMFILGSDDFLLGSFIYDYSYIRATVRNALPDCVFDIQLDAIQFASDSGHRLLRKLRYFQGIWISDFSHYRLDPN